MSDQINHQQRLKKLELIVLAVLVVAGAWLRLSNLSNVAIDHFDEGVYASNIWFDVDQGLQYPNRHLYAPPLLPWLTEWSIIFFGPNGIGPHLVSLAAGIAMIPLLWWVARRWFGTETAVATATLAALNDFHILYSRIVLTDALLCLLFLLAVYLFWEAFRRDHLGWTLAAGGATGLAWCVKYNGWLPLAIAASGGAAWLLVRRASLREMGWVSLKWFIAAGVAFAVWSPVLRELQDHPGGYLAVAENHGKYMVGWGGWLIGAEQHLATQLHLSGWLTWLSLPLAIGAAMAFGLANQDNKTTDQTPKKNKASKKAPSKSKASTGEASKSETNLALWFLAAWFFGLLLTTPLYAPYPRLLLPWLVCCWLVAGAGMVWFVVPYLDTEETSWKKKCLPLLITVALVGVAAFGFYQFSGKRTAAWQDRSGLKKTAASMISNTDDSKTVFLVYGEPAVFYHLRAQGAIALPIADLAFADPKARVPTGPVYLVAGPHAQQSQRFVESLSNHRRRLTLVRTYAFRPSDVVMLNRSHADQLDASSEEYIRLYRFQ